MCLLVVEGSGRGYLGGTEVRRKLVVTVLEYQKLTVPLIYTEIYFVCLHDMTAAEQCGHRSVPVGLLFPSRFGSPSSNPIDTKRLFRDMAGQGL